MYTKEHLGSLLLKAGEITSTQLEEALSVADRDNRRIGEILIEKGYMSEERVNHFLGIQLGYPGIKLDHTYIDHETSRKIPEKFSRRYGIVPLYKTETEKGPVVVVAMADPTNIKVKDEIQQALEEKIFVVLAPSREIDKVLDRIWKEETSADMQAERLAARSELLPVSSDDAKPSIAKILETIFTRALEMRASAIHFEPKNKYAGVRYKIDGAFHTITSFPLETYQSVLTRIKILAKIPIAESVLSVEEGRFHLRPDLVNPFVDIRVTIVPEVFGEKAILKLTRRDEIIRPLDAMGLETEQLPALNFIIMRNTGLLLISGRYDSGRTTMAYSLLSAVGTSSNMIVTVEDPPAYPISSFNQVKKLKNLEHVNLWDQTLRVVESQEPSIVYLSNIDTKEEAKMMLRFASTGRRVISTIYADDATSTHWVPLQLGADAYALAWAYAGAISCRLIRTLCIACRKPISPSREILSKFRLSETDLAGAPLFAPTGCDSCNGTGFGGRTGVYELFQNHDHIRDMIEARESSDRIRAAAIESGMLPFRDAALAKVKRGLTSLGEVEQLLK